MANRELDELLEKIEDIRSAEPLTSDDMDLIVKLIKGESDRKKTRRTGPAIGQTYWFAHIDYTDSYTYTAGYFDLDIYKHTSIYPEERFAEAELRAKELIQSVNKRRRELNESKESEGCQYYIVFWKMSGLNVQGLPSLAHARGIAYPFGLFKESADCETCIHEFEDELKWFYKDYLPLMAELDDYDWSEAPGWGEEA